jgi:hypothetical protein
VTEKPRKEKTLSSTQIKMLQNVRDGLSPVDHLRTMAEYGGADGTLRSLVRRELLAYEKNEIVITAFGRITLRELGK